MSGQANPARRLLDLSGVFLLMDWTEMTRSNTRMAACQKARALDEREALVVL
jgi:hypothetical protein